MNEFRKCLKRERQIELMGEGHRYFDLRRWKDAAVEDENGETTEETVKETTKKESAKVTDTPKTGDSANVGLYTALLIISALGIAAVALLRKKI